MTTIKDVARALNISITTVSRALDGYDDVADETRLRVIATAEKLGYAPNRAARQLRRQRSETVGFIIPASAPHFNEPFFTEFISGLGDALSERNYDLLVANATSDQQERNFYQRWIRARKVDGMVVNRVCAHDWRIQLLAQANFPYAVLGKSLDQADYPCVQIDGEQSYVELVHHLHRRGFRRLSFIGGQVDLMEHRNQSAWFQSALSQCGLFSDPGLSVCSDLTSSGGYEAARALLSRAEPPDALVCINDETAFGALHAAHEKGLRVGQELGIAGFDGVTAARHTEPPLTTIAIPLYEIARQLAVMLMEKIEAPSVIPADLEFRPEFIERASTRGIGAGE